MAIIRTNTVESPLPVTGTVETNELNQAAWQVSSVTVATSGTPVQGPSIAIPHQVPVAVLNPMTNTANVQIFVANSSANTAIPGSRVELRRGESVSLNLTNANLVWVDASANGATAKFIVEA